MSFYTFMGALEQGFAYALMALGVYLTFRVLDFPDLTVDGSLPLGAAVSATWITTGGDPYVSIALGVVAGMVAGWVTAFLATKLKILHLLASILTMIALYSVNLRVMGRPNITLLTEPTVFAPLEGRGLPNHILYPLVFAAVVLVCGVLLWWFLHTELGLALRATGDNPAMITAQGVNTTFTVMLGLALSNGLVALSGALVAQSQGSADVGMGVGTIVAGLASVILGEALVGDGSVGRALLGVVLGSVVYRLAIATALSVRFGDLALTPSDLNLITAVLVVVALGVPGLRSKLLRRRAVA
ncbi:ABC transporter permease [Deferrisoma camini]|uniref:ABC transporter permease n=1 Tax=Deferrisoma camini TaxID=1035120 RepID=UPI00046D3EFD|nr:ABC transporter permease [Deferrisoma camini]